MKRERTDWMFTGTWKQKAAADLFYRNIKSDSVWNISRPWKVTFKTFPGLPASWLKLLSAVWLHTNSSSKLSHRHTHVSPDVLEVALERSTETTADSQLTSDWLSNICPISWRHLNHSQISSWSSSRVTGLWYWSGLSWLKLCSVFSSVCLPALH